MLALAQCLQTYVAQHFHGALARDAAATVRPVLVGPPDSALEALFALLTRGGQGNWQLNVNGMTHEIIVLLIDSTSVLTSHDLSQGCHWDYAVTVRNSRPLVLILAARNSWDNRPESLANTTETLGRLAAVPDDAPDSLQAYLSNAVAVHLGLQHAQARELIKIVRKESLQLEPADRDLLSWEVFNNLLATAPGGSPIDNTCRAAGLPIIGTSNKTFSESLAVLCSLAEFVGAEGLHEAVDQMKSTNAANNHGASQSLDELEAHLSTVLFSPTAFETAPTRYYRPSAPLPAWYDALTATVLSDVLEELNQGQPQGRLTLTCTNGLLGGRPLRKGPFVVSSTAELQASNASGAPIPGLTFSRKIDRAAAVQLTPAAANPLQCSDTAPPAHRKPIKYKIEAPNCRPGSVDILVLDTFTCGGIVIVRDADRNGVPSFATRANTWSQELTLLRGGATELLVFHGANAHQVAVLRTGEPAVTQPADQLSHYASFVLDVEDTDTLQVTITDAAGTQVGTWTLQVIVRDISDISSSRLEALIREHRTKRRSTPHAPDIPLHRLELGSYLPHADSWKPVLACWSANVPSSLSIDWNSNRILGDVQPQIDPRQTIAPSAPLLAARDRVRTLLHAGQRCISEIDIDDPSLLTPIEDYLREFTNWLQQVPEEACWFDVMAIYTAEWNAQAGRHGASEEPALVLLSPLHPLRLAWHAVAQAQLSESLPTPCAAAGLLNPSQCPDSSILFLWDGHSKKPRAFFSLPCEHPHWAVLINTGALDKPEQRSSAMRCLSELGLMVQAITGGFTSQQTQDSLREVNRLLPARATLRIGIVGDAESSSECGEGVFQWSESEHSQDTLSATGCLQVEVFDTRGASDPSPEQLADLSETTSERVRWFKLPPNSAVPYLDLTIIDQLGARSHEPSTGTTRSTLAHGALFRVRVREDFHNARAIVESRVSDTRLPSTNLAGLLCNAVKTYEELTLRDAMKSHFRFTPNQEAVGTRLQNAIFLSVTSSQIDPACIVRGTIGQGGYLWDYELPSVLGGGESSLGYYLVAKPTPAMNRSIESAAQLVANPPPNVPGLLEEISRHGIPILKRLASGGSQSRGELGLLLATRILQDAFRPGAGTIRLPVWNGTCIHFVLPIDPYEELFDRLRKSLLPASTTAQRPDLVVVAIHFPDQNRPISIKLTPIEVKYRAGGMGATDMRGALTQAENLGRLFTTVWVQNVPSELWATCSSALLAQFLDFGFRIYAGHWLHGHQPEEWAAIHQRIIQDVLERQAQILVNDAGRLFVFGGATTSVSDLDGDGRQDTVVVSQQDSHALLMNPATLSATADLAIRQLDFSFPSCGVGLVAQPAAPAPATQPTGPTPPTSPPDGPAPAAISPTVASPTDPPPPAAIDTATGPADAPQSSVTPPSRPPTRIPAEVRQRVREAFEGFVGNDPAITRLSNDLLRALIERPPHLAKNFLLTGLPSTGKTELARRMAQALALPFIKLDGRGVPNRERLFELIKGELQANNLAASQVAQQLGLPVLEYPPLIVFIDEVHLLPRVLQEALLTMLETADRTVVLSDHVARVHRATFLFATTRVSDVDPAFASRCDEIQLREYSESEVSQILRWKLQHDDWPQAVYESVARLGRCVPRIAIQLAEALETAQLVSEEDKPLVDHLEDVRRAREIDTRGLTRMDFEYLGILERGNGPVGEQNILNLMRTVDKDRILNEVEPFLVRLGFIQHGPRGRELTAEGREYLLAHRLNPGQ